MGEGDARITLLTDFGTADGYVAAMKGVIASIAPGATLDDVGHDVPQGDVLRAAWSLSRYWNRFPAGTVHLVVVDPGVGTERRALAFLADGRFVVAPDNGVVSRVLTQAERWSAIEIGVGPGDRSATFHGRDVFAPAAAEIHHAGRDRLASVRRLAPTANWIDLRLPTPTLGADEAHGEVLVVDGFGNVITNVPGATVEPHFGETVRVNGEVVPVRRTYGEVDLGERLVTVGSHDGVELAANQARGDEAFGLDPHDPVHLAW